MNWYKKAQNKEPWQMTREEYRQVPYPPLKPHDIFYVRVGSGEVEVIQNPTEAEMREMTSEFREQFPHYKSTPALRSTQDVNGNKYYWKSNESMHAYLEPQLSRMVGAKLNQNAARPDYNRVIYEALQEGKQISPEIFNDFAKQYPDVAKEFNNY